MISEFCATLIEYFIQVAQKAGEFCSRLIAWAYPWVANSSRDIFNRIAWFVISSWLEYIIEWVTEVIERSQGPGQMILNHGEIIISLFFSSLHLDCLEDELVPYEKIHIYISVFLYDWSPFNKKAVTQFRFRTKTKLYSRNNQNSLSQIMKELPQGRFKNDRDSTKKSSYNRPIYLTEHCDTGLIISYREH